MKTHENNISSARKRHAHSFWQAFLTVLSLFALAATFVLSLLDLRFETKVGSFAGIVIAYLISCFLLYFLQNRRDARSIRENDSSDTLFNSDIENRLFALEEANRFFGTSLKPPDMFRLVSSRVNELVPFAACVLFLKGEKSGELRTAYVDGENAEILKDPGIDVNKGLAAKTAMSNKPQRDDKLVTEKASKPSAALEGFRSAIAVPLNHGLEVFGVLQLYSGAKGEFDQGSLTILEAVGARVAPLFISSRAFERTLSNALTDTLTNLPNERAFYMLLENQLAESQRYRDERPLTILAVDIKNFAEINKEFGHAAGDRVLTFAADIVKGQLRKMDFLSRSVNDEFLAVLPTAPEKVALEIIERIERALVTTPFEISTNQFTNLQFNFGCSTFWKDGETAPELLQNALLRKQQNKSDEPKKVLWFPREYVN
jgi:diguanylate cyclase (GGDEF)-like protein